LEYNVLDDNLEFQFTTPFVFTNILIVNTWLLFIWKSHSYNYLVILQCKHSQLGILCKSCHFVRTSCLLKNEALKQLLRSRFWSDHLLVDESSWVRIATLSLNMLLNNRNINWCMAKVGNMQRIIV